MNFYTNPIPFQPSAIVSDIYREHGQVYFQYDTESRLLSVHSATSPEYASVHGFRTLNNRPLKEGYHVIGTFGSSEAIENTEPPHASYLVHAKKWVGDGFILECLAESGDDSRKAINLFILKEHAEKFEQMKKDSQEPSISLKWEDRKTKFPLSLDQLNTNHDYDPADQRDRHFLLFGLEDYGYATLAYFRNTEEGPCFHGSDIAYFDYSGEDPLFTFPPHLVEQIPNPLDRRSIFLTIMSAYRKGKVEERQRCLEILGKAAKMIV